MRTETNRSVLQLGIDTKGREIRYGDRLFVRVMMHGRETMSCMLDNVSKMTEVLAEVRRRCVDVRGLAVMSVRNQSRGWGVERPVMLYGGGHMRGRMAEVLRGAVRQADAEPMRRTHITFPWETH